MESRSTKLAVPVSGTGLVAVGPAIVVGGYWLVAWLGQKRIERELASDEA